MLSAIIALLIMHVPAVPQNSILTANEVAAETTPTAESDTITKLESPDHQLVKSKTTPQTPTSDGAPQNSQPYPSASVTFTPSGLVPEPIGPTKRAFAASVSRLSPSAPTAFTATTLSLAQIRSEQRRRRVWLTLSIAQIGAATFDAWSTRRVIASGQGQEMNPLLRPFAGNGSLYAVIQVGPTLLDYLGRRMMTSQHGWARHTWWIPQVAGMASSLLGGMHNLRLHSSP
jgi:hypothetical protein